MPVLLVAAPIMRLIMIAVCWEIVEKLDQNQHTAESTQTLIVGHLEQSKIKCLALNLFFYLPAHFRWCPIF